MIPTSSNHQAPNDLDCSESPESGTAPIRFPRVELRQWTLPNGLVLLVKEDRSAPVASVQAWCAAGSIHEDEWLGAGLSHILEHMLFKGTESRTTGQIATAVQDAGGYMNAYTSFDRTVYWIDTPSEGVPVALDVLADVMTKATIPEEEYAKEQEVIRREFAMGFDDPDRMSSELVFSTAFQVHPYGIPVIGHLDVFNTLTRDDVLAYYRRHYVPNNMFFVVVGDVDAEAVHAQVAKLFVDIPRAKYPPVLVPSEPLQLGRREVHQEFATQLTRLTLAWRIPDVTHPDMPALDVLSTILGDGRSSRLYRKVRDTWKLVHSIDAYSYTPAHGGLFAVSAEHDPEKRQAVTDAILKIIGEIQCDGVTDEEVEKARKMTLASQIGSLTTMRGQASDIGGNWNLTRNVQFTGEYLEAIQRVTPEDVRDVALRYMIERTLSVTSLNPVGTLAVANRKAGFRNEAEVRRHVFSNGLTLLLREDSRLPLVSVLAAFRAGTLAETDADAGISRLCTRTLLKGTTTRTAEEISGAIESVGGSIGASAGNNSVMVSAGVMRPDIGLALDLVADVILNPTFPEEALEVEREAQRAAIQEEDDRMMTVATKALRKTLFPGHPYARTRNGTEESVDAVDRSALELFHRRYFVARNTVLAIYGAIDAEAMIAEVERRFGAMPEGESPFEAPPLPAPLTGSAEVAQFLDKKQAVVVVGFPSVDMRHPDRDALDLLDEACSDMASRFFVRIREELGLAYYVGTSQVLGLAPGAFIFYVGTSPEKAGLVERELVDEIEKLAEHGLTLEELERAKKTWLGKQKIEMQSNGAVAQVTVLDELFGLGHANYEAAFRRIEHFTVEDMREITRRYLHEKARVVVRVLPEK
jgi:zinc protease